jgi:hypothetical protein
VLQRGEWLIVLALCVVLAIGAGTASAQTAEGDAFLTIADGRFFKDGRPFSIRASCCDPAVGHWFKFRGSWWEDGIRQAKALGFNAIRTWVPGTGEPTENAATYTRWQADREDFYREFDRVFIDRAREEGIYLVLTLTTLPESVALGSKYDVDSAAYAAWREFARDFCGHYKDEPQILFWEVANEYRGEGHTMAETRRFYEQAARDLRAADPNHLISSGVDYWRDTDPGGHAMWLAINGSDGIDVASAHAYSNDPWTINWHTERDYQRVVRDLVEVAAPLHKPLFLGEFGAQPRLTANDENPEIVWFMEAVIREGIPAYGFHWFYPAPEPGLFRVIPSLSPKTAQWMNELNALAAAGEEVPADFGPRTTDYAFPICMGDRPLAGPAPDAEGQVQVVADEGVFGRAAPSLKITWQGAGEVQLGPYHPNDLSEYAEAGGALRFALRTDAALPEGVRLTVGDSAGGTAAVDLSAYQPPPGLWTTVAVPMSSLGIDWTAWRSLGLQFPANTQGALNIDDIRVSVRTWMGNEGRGQRQDGVPTRMNTDGHG